MSESEPSRLPLPSMGSALPPLSLPPLSLPPMRSDRLGMSPMDASSSYPSPGVSHAMISSPMPQCMASPLAHNVSSPAGPVPIGAAQSPLNHGYGNNSNANRNVNVANAPVKRRVNTADHNTMSALQQHLSSKHSEQQKYEAHMRQIKSVPGSPNPFSNPPTPSSLPVMRYNSMDAVSSPSSSLGQSPASQSLRSPPSPNVTSNGTVAQQQVFEQTSSMHSAVAHRASCQPSASQATAQADQSGIVMVPTTIMSNRPINGSCPTSSPSTSSSTTANSSLPSSRAVLKVESSMNPAQQSNQQPIQQASTNALHPQQQMSSQAIVQHLPLRSGQGVAYASQVQNTHQSSSTALIQHHPLPATSQQQHQIQAGSQMTSGLHGQQMQQFHQQSGYLPQTQAQIQINGPRQVQNIPQQQVQSHIQQQMAMTSGPSQSQQQQIMVQTSTQPVTGLSMTVQQTSHSMAGQPQSRQPNMQQRLVQQNSNQHAQPGQVPSSHIVSNAPTQSQIQSILTQRISVASNPTSGPSNVLMTVAGPGPMHSHPVQGHPSMPGVSVRSSIPPGGIVHMRPAQMQMVPTGAPGMVAPMILTRSQPPANLQLSQVVDEKLLRHSAQAPHSQSKEQYRMYKRKFKHLVFENECYQEELRNLQRKLLKLSRDKNFLLDRLTQFEKLSDSSDEDSDASQKTVDDRPKGKKRARVQRKRGISPPGGRLVDGCMSGTPSPCPSPAPGNLLAQMLQPSSSHTEDDSKIFMDDGTRTMNLPAVRSQPPTSNAGVQQQHTKSKGSDMYPNALNGYIGAAQRIGVGGPDISQSQLNSPSGNNPVMGSGSVYPSSSFLNGAPTISGGSGAFNGGGDCNNVANEHSSSSQNTLPSTSSGPVSS